MPVRSVRLILPILALLGCDPEIVELVPDAVGDAGAEDTGAPDTGVPDTGSRDVGFPDAGLDAGFDDAGFDDAGFDDAGFACVCRYTSCGATPDCAVVGPRSTCERGTCTGATGRCQSDAECGNGWRCTLGETSLDPCP